MVTKITILEPHIDGAQFGPASIGTDVDEGEPETGDESERGADEPVGRSAGTRRTAVVLAAAVLSLLAVVGALAARKMRESPPEEEAPTVSTADEIPVQ